MQNIAENSPEVKCFSIFFDFTTMQFQVWAEREDSSISLFSDWADFIPDHIFSIVSPDKWTMPDKDDHPFYCHHCYPGIDDDLLSGKDKTLTFRLKSQFLNSNDLPKFTALTGIVYYDRSLKAPTLNFRDIEQIHIIGWLSSSDNVDISPRSTSFPSDYSPHGTLSGHGSTKKASTPTDQVPAKKRPKKQPHLRIVRHNRPPKDVLKYFSTIPTLLTWQPVLKAMYKHSKYLDRKHLHHYTGHYNRRGRFYLNGNEFLYNSLVISRQHLSTILSWMKSHGVIKLRHRGYKGEGNSIWELPHNLAHVFAWKREPPK